MAPRWRPQRRYGDKSWGSASPPGREEAEKFSKLDFAQRHALKLNLLERWGSFPAAGDRHIAEFLSFALTPSKTGPATRYDFYFHDLTPRA